MFEVGLFVSTSEGVFLHIALRYPDISEYGLPSIGISINRQGAIFGSDTSGKSNGSYVSSSRKFDYGSLRLSF